MRGACAAEPTQQQPGSPQRRSDCLRTRCCRTSLTALSRRCPPRVLCCHCCSYMPDLLSVRVVGRLRRAKRAKLYHLLEDEGPRHVYQASVGAPGQAQR